MAYAESDLQRDATPHQHSIDLLTWLVAGKFKAKRVGMRQTGPMAEAVGGGSRYDETSSRLSHGICLSVFLSPHPDLASGRTQTYRHRG